MSFSITEKCVGCHACLIVCPNKAVYRDPDVTRQFRIHSRRCDECANHFDDPQCASICPIEEAIIDAAQLPLNPLGSLQPQGIRSE
ncbi:4Fe-4S dicluster domain-containing protein [Vibrio tritonius]|uniref:4Fe-4S dicluster domain-containing protein n=1 Tax=Vibrio tritonius TaxID=1435069 RepID=A0ABS7YVG3_9VIBR|nr:4Fe-4S dicluster domain-containing protein [Vibrio tritonius]MCA2018982.1 4Fe-4S dicluster domain-containing protein [Vibrio tritonius]